MTAEIINIQTEASGESVVDLLIEVFVFLAHYRRTCLEESTKSKTICEETHFIT